MSLKIFERRKHVFIYDRNLYHSLRLGQAFVKQPNKYNANMYVSSAFISLINQVCIILNLLLLLHAEKSKSL